MIGPQFPEESPTRVPVKTLREFAALTLVIFGAMFTVSFVRHSGHPTAAAWVALVLAVVVGLPGLVRPGSIRPVYLAAMNLTKPIGHVISFVLLGFVYFVLLTPIALVFRLIGRDALLRARPVHVTSYWTDRAPTTNVKRYLRQYQSQVAELARPPESR
jgi:hypothetical protein